MASSLAQLYHWWCVFLTWYHTYLLVSCLGSWWCDAPHSALRLPRAHEGSSAMWQQHDILGGMLGCKVQSLVDAWQLACSAVMLLRLDTPTTANILLFYPPTPQMQKQRKIQEPRHCFFHENVLSINHYRSCWAFVDFPETSRLNQSIWNTGRRKLVHPCLFHIRDSEHNWINVFKYLSELIQPLWDGWYCT